MKYQYVCGKINAFEIKMKHSDKSTFKKKIKINHMSKEKNMNRW